MTLENGRSGMHRPKPHFCRIEAGPFTVGDGSENRQVEFRNGGVRCEHQPRRTVRNLGAVAGGNVSVLAIEERLELREIFGRRVFADTIIGWVELAVGAVEWSDLGVEVAGLLRGEHPGMALRRQFIHIPSRDSEAESQILRSLSHQQANHGVGEALHDADHRLERFRRFQA